MAPMCRWRSRPQHQTETSTPRARVALLLSTDIIQLGAARHDSSLDARRPITREWREQRDWTAGKYAAPDRGRAAGAMKFTTDRPLADPDNRGESCRHFEISSPYATRTQLCCSAFGATSVIPIGIHSPAFRNCAQRAHCFWPLSTKRRCAAWPPSRISATTACLPLTALSKVCPTANRYCSTSDRRTERAAPFAKYFTCP